MGPTNLALVNLFKADQQLREAQARLEAASKDVRIQERRVHDLAARLQQGEQKAKQLQSKSGLLDVDLKSRDAKIEKLRTQQQNAKNNKEYQAFLIEINTGKVDRAKVEEEALKVVGQVESQQKENVETKQLLEAETGKLEALKGSIEQKLAGFRGEVEQVRPARDAAAGEVAKLSAKVLAVYERLADRYDGEAMAPIARSNPRSEQWMCTACNMELVIDIYNRLKTRDELVMCPNCGRVLYIPEDLPAVQPTKPKAPSRASATKKVSAAATKSPGAPVDPVTAELRRLLTRAAGESARNAVAAGNTPLEFEVYIEGKFLGVYKGQNIDNFRRTARYCLHEAGVIKDMEVFDKGQGPINKKDEAKPAATATAATAADAAATESPADAAEPAAAAAPAPVPGPDVPTEPPSPEVSAAAESPVVASADAGDAPAIGEDEPASTTGTV